MKLFFRVLVLTLLIGMCGSAAAVYAAEEMNMAKSGMDPAMMEKMKAAMAPGEAHKLLEQLAGNWTYTSAFWMDPNGQPETSTGSSQNSTIYGGRFLKQNITGAWMGQPFEGTGYLGYDNVKEMYQSVWIDGMATGIMTESGQYDPATNTLRMSGVNSCPMTGEKEMPVRSEWKIVDADHNLYTAYMKDKSGKEVKGMEISYTRA